AGDFVGARGVAVERVVTAGFVLLASVVVKEREKTAGVFGLARGVVVGGDAAPGGIAAAARRVGVERVRTDGSIKDAGGVVKERVITEDCVAIGEVAALLTNRSRLRRKRKAGEREQREGGIYTIRFYFHCFIFFHLSSPEIAGRIFRKSFRL